jgi:hypothetical protein
MKKVIELLERAESEVSCVCVAADGKYPGRNRKLLDSTIRHIRETIAELKSPPRWKPPEYGGAEFHKNCITCKNWGHCPVDIDIINQELEPFPSVNRFGIYCGYYEKDFITPEQWEKRTGKAWPDDWAVYYRYSYDHKTYREWRVGSHKNIVDSRADFETHNAGTHQIVCATEAGPPPDGWMPEE